METLVCAGHHARIEAGENWLWDDRDRVILMGTDLDSGGVLVPVGWKVESSIGRSEFVVECETPSGQPADPVRFLIDPEREGPLIKFLLDQKFGGTTSSDPATDATPDEPTPPRT